MFLIWHHSWSVLPYRRDQSALPAVPFVVCVCIVCLLSSYHRYRLARGNLLYCFFPLHILAILCSYLWQLPLGSLLIRKLNRHNARPIGTAMYVCRHVSSGMFPSVVLLLLGLFSAVVAGPRWLVGSLACSMVCWFFVLGWLAGCITCGR